MHPALTTNIGQCQHYASLFALKRLKNASYFVVLLLLLLWWWCCCGVVVFLWWWWCCCDVLNKHSEGCKVFELQCKLWILKQIRWLILNQSIQ